MADYILQQSSAPIRSASGVQFGVLSPDQIRSMSALEACTINGKNIPAGVTDSNTRDYLTGEVC